MADWAFGFALNNLVLAKDARWSASGVRDDGVDGGIDLGTKDIAIVSGEDSRLADDCQERPAVASLLASFRSPTGTAFSPACLIVRKSAPDPVATLDAILPFRNAVAVSFVLRARAGAINEDGIRQPYWADTFDLFPAEVNNRGRLMMWTPARVDLMNHTREYRFGESPFVGRMSALRNADSYLHYALASEWRRRFQSLRPSRFSRRLFRSLEVAYEAACIPTHNQESLQDWGVKIGLWVSAMEILARPTDGDVDQSVVRALLAKYSWVDDQLDAPRYIVRFHRAGGKSIAVRVNAIQKLCTLIYKARNDFLHGNPIGRTTLRGQHDISLPIAAGLVYRTALAAYLQYAYPPVTTLRQLMKRGHEAMCSYSYARALRRAMGLRDRPAMA
jgi:hypothetical protein